MAPPHSELDHRNPVTALYATPEKDQIPELVTAFHKANVKSSINLDKYPSLKHLGRRDLSPYLGTEIIGLDLTQVTEEQVEDLKKLIIERGVLHFRDQEKLGKPELVEFGKKFGPPHIHPTIPAPADAPELIYVHSDPTRQNAAESWHSDVTFEEQPAKYSILKFDVTPEVGGDTAFTDTFAAYDKLSDKLKEILSTLEAEHSGVHVFGKFPLKSADNPINTNVHPVIRSHPVTGRHALYVNGNFTTKIIGLHKKESDFLLNYLYNHIANCVEAQVRVRWTNHSVALWDNTHTQHSAIADFFPALRSGHRYTSYGERPFYKPRPDLGNGNGLYDTPGWKRLLETGERYARTSDPVKEGDSRA
ncbi:hypothetical protein HK097_001444 [Rhizophlyctis rosea]|uniref:TauD/TfdA-like domain-containing protein n=1 Tax=Rhizophlyctis rosea TaxID=64517 RepID=A0AAD5X4E0_9FUNG|nr:hypothetical protein HK097_001444 [Rhizophlyctis rosea]